MKAIFFTFLFVAPTAVNAQTAAEWQAEHPNGVLLSTSTYSSLSAKEIALLGEEFFVFDSTVQEQEKQVQKNRPVDLPVSYQDEAIKAWKDHHPDVMIVSRSAYEGAGDDELQVMEELRALILAGETITFEDITNYVY